MLPRSHSQAYQELIILLQKFQICFENFDTEFNNTTINQQFQDLQVFFKQHITPLTDDDLTEESSLRWRGVATEIYREFKLLTTDLLFLRTSRQAKTKQGRVKSICDRISKLIAYCEAITTQE